MSVEAINLKLSSSFFTAVVLRALLQHVYYDQILANANEQMSLAEPYNLFAEGVLA